MNVHQTITPAILVFDDDPTILDWARSNFYEATSLGVITANSLEQARELITDKRINFRAILSDISVAPDKQDVEHGLQSGIDLLDLAKRERPDVTAFAFSIWGEPQTRFQAQSKERGLKIRRWFQKLASEPFWMSIEKELASEKCSTGRKRQGEQAAAPSEKSNISPETLTRTYLQAVPGPYDIVAPIEVLCRSDLDGSWIADAMSLSLLQPGIGDSKEEALENLGELMIEQLERLEAAPASEVTAYSEELQKALKQYLRLRTPVAS